MTETTAQRAAAELVLSPTHWIDESSKMRALCDLRLSISQFTTHRWSMRDDAVQFPRLGVSGVGLSRQKISELGKKESLKLLKRSGLRPTSLALSGGFAGANGMTCKEALKDSAKAVRLARKAGTDVLIVTSGSRGDHTRSHALRNTRHCLLKLADYAAGHGVKIALMPMRGIGSESLSMIETLDDALEVIGRVNHPFLQLAFNTFHLGNTPDLLTRIAEIGRLVASVQISDLPKETDDTRLGLYGQKKPGHGILSLPDIVQAFDVAGYRGAYELNVWSERVWKSDYHSMLAGCVRYLHEQVLQPINSPS